MKRKKLFSILALLVMAVTGAWAQTEQSETIATTASVVNGTHFTISNNGGSVDNSGMSADKGITVTPKNGETITKVVIHCKFGSSLVVDNNISVSSGTKEITNSGKPITVKGVNAKTFTFTCVYQQPQFDEFVVYYTEPSVAVTGVTLSQTSASMTVGGTLTLTPTVLPANATDKTVTWTTSNASVATVSNGVVTAVAAGTATITATATNGTATTSDDKTATCTVTDKYVASEIAFVVNQAALKASVHNDDITQKLLETIISDTKPRTTKAILDHYEAMRRQMNQEQSERRRIGF